ncbi:MAG: 2Fe-2S iron-sulfur cluster-binding protein [Candidatus Korobacteraceae bacterium]|jgi:succinate dehydrogenase/fumarate reductase-like Fe-S protein
MDVRLKVFRFDPDTDAVPHYTNYSLPWTEGLTLLAAIRRIYETLDPGLGFRNYFCGRGLCSGCLMTVDGKTKHSCHVLLDAEREYLVEPLKDYPVIRDLVVDYGAKRTDPESGRVYDIRVGASVDCQPVAAK